MVPVGGAIVASTSAPFLKLLSSCYPGRASSSPILDLFITLLSMGETGYKNLLAERTRNLPIFKEKLYLLCEKHGLSLIPSPKNSISYAVSIDILSQSSKSYTFFGSMLFQRCVSGCRVVNTSKSTVSKINGIEFTNWGSHHNSYPFSYFTAACAIGMKYDEIDLFIERLEKVIVKFKKLNQLETNNQSEITSTQLKEAENLKESAEDLTMIETGI